MQGGRFNATIEIRTRNPDVIYSALKPDISHIVEGHTRSRMKLVNGSVVIDISSEDLSHLRASLNSYLRLAKIAISCLDVTL
ncbi:MAG: KEOPS complex subunit Pcc1 [Nitrososphaerales archaeon]